jgi:hypothetical protein
LCSGEEGGLKSIILIFRLNTQREAGVVVQWSSTYLACASLWVWFWVLKKIFKKESKSNHNRYKEGIIKLRIEISQVENRNSMKPKACFRIINDFKKSSCIRYTKTLQLLLTSYKVIFNNSIMAAKNTKFLRIICQNIGKIIHWKLLIIIERN